MSADFWAGYISGAAGILIGNPLDLIKVRMQAGPPSATAPVPPPSAVGTASSILTPPRFTNPFTTASSLIRGATAPIIGYGALNALLFMTYNRSLSLLQHGTYPPPPAISPSQPSLGTTFVAGALGGLATWIISTPTELIKVRAQLSHEPISSVSITRTIIASEGFRGLYYGGLVTALRDSIGYGFYFWSYELGTRWMRDVKWGGGESGEDWGLGEQGQEAAKVLLCGGMAGVITWASVFPLDVVKTRVQSQLLLVQETSPLLVGSGDPNNVSRAKQPRLGAWQMAKSTYKTEGAGVFFRGLGVCSIRAFIVNAAQWAVYEWIMKTLDPGRLRDGAGADKIAREEASL